MLKKIWEWIKEKTGYKAELENYKKLCDEYYKEIEHLKKEFLNNELTKESVILIRHLLGSIDLSDARDQKELSPEERKEYVSRIASTFDITNKIGKRLTIAQEEYIGLIAENTKQLMFGRGTLNGIMIFREELEDAFKEHMVNIQPPKPFDRSKLFPELKNNE